MIGSDAASRPFGMEVCQPAPIKRDGRRRPARGDRCIGDNGKFRNQLRTAVLQCPRLELGKARLGLGIEIVAGNFGIPIGSPAKEAADIAPVFAVQSVSIVFWMTLQKQEQTPTLPHKHVGTGFGRAQQDLIAAGRKHVLGKAVVPRMGNEPLRRLTRYERVVIGAVIALEDTRKLRGEGMSLDAVQVKNGGMSGKTGPN